LGTALITIGCIDVVFYNHTPRKALNYIGFMRNNSVVADFLISSNFNDLALLRKRFFWPPQQCRRNSAQQRATSLQQRCNNAQQFEI
jgi:hypothetical protein